MPEQTFPLIVEEFELEVQDALGHWCRLRGSSPSMALMKLRLISIWGKDIPTTGVRVIKISRMEELADMEKLIKVKCSQ